MHHPHLAETQFLSSSQVFSFPGQISLTIDSHDLIYVKLRCHSGLIMSPEALGIWRSGMAFTPIILLLVDPLLSCSICQSQYPLPNTRTDSYRHPDAVSEHASVEPQVHPSATGLPQSFHSIWSPGRPETRKMVRKRNINYRLPISQLQTTCSKGFLKRNFFRMLTAWSHTKHILNDG